MEKRIEYIDVSKAILIILVVIGHAIQLNEQDEKHVLLPVLQFIQTFHMSAFFVINGMLFNGGKWTINRWKEYFVKKCKALFIPYLFFEVIGALFVVLIFHEANIKGAVFNSVAQYYNVGADWFLISLFFADIMLYFISKIDNKAGYIIMVICLIMPSYMGFNHYIVFAGRCILALGFVLVGYYAKHFFLKVKKKYAILSICILLMISIINGFTAFVSCSINNPILYAIGGVSGTIFILSISQSIHSRIMKYIGENTLPIMGTHQNILKLMCKTIQPNSIKSVGIILLEILIFECFFVPISNRYFPIFIGKRYKALN